MTWHYPTNTGTSLTNFTRSQHSILFYIKGKKPNTFNKKDISVPYKNPTDKRIIERIQEGSKGRTPYDVFHFNIVKNINKEKTSHPCQLPKDLIKIFIKASSNENDIVLDLFGGSFTTAVASKELKRNSISIENNRDYCLIGKRRIKKNTPFIEIIETGFIDNEIITTKNLIHWINPKNNIFAAQKRNEVV